MTGTSMTGTSARLCLCIAMLAAVALADLADVLRPETCPNTPMGANASGPDCATAVAEAAAEDSLTNVAVAGVVFVQLAVTVVVVILFQRHMKAKED